MGIVPTRQLTDSCSLDIVDYSRLSNPNKARSFHNSDRSNQDKQDMIVLRKMDNWKKRQIGTVAVHGLFLEIPRTTIPN